MKMLATFLYRYTATHNWQVTDMAPPLLSLPNLRNTTYESLTPHLKVILSRVCERDTALQSVVRCHAHTTAMILLSDVVVGPPNIFVWKFHLGREVCNVSTLLLESN